MKRHWLILYDIGDETRLRRVAKIMEQVAVRVQRSVYEGYFDTRTLSRLRRDVQSHTEPEDLVSYVRLCRKDWSKAMAYGSGSKTGLRTRKGYRIL